MRSRQAKKNRRKAAVAKTKNLPLYLAHKGELWGATKKEALLRGELLLFFIDMEAFRRFGQSITGGVWVKGREHFEWRPPQ